MEGSELATLLTSHKINVEVQRIEAREGDVAQTLGDHAMLYATDMIVMVGYVHSRLRELVFGGVTPSVLKSNPVPLFMSS